MHLAVGAPGVTAPTAGAVLDGQERHIRACPATIALDSCQWGTGVDNQGVLHISKPTPWLYVSSFHHPALACSAVERVRVRAEVSGGERVQSAVGAWSWSFDDIPLLR